MATAAGTPRRTRRARERRGQVVAYAVVVIFLLWVLVPIAVIVSNSLKPTGDIFADPPHWLFSPTL
ncbi:MAG: hypothetical protein QOI43_2319, partial [Gaiellales bacterium]|nr:hypothetical protein [Gaiellales bacterium]